MAKRSTIKTPDWILKGNEKPSKKKQGKTFKIKKCPKCRSDKVSVVLGEEEGRGRGEWQCGKCKWKGRDVDEEELSEDEFIKYLDKKEK